jgi:aryl-alcohol dehydrogenase-like predicted oxidoreductase
MRLSTAIERDENAAIRVICRAIDEGITLFDTADAYALDERDVGHNERLIARALADRPKVRPNIVVATKGGLRRPDGLWVPDGRAKHLRAACEESLRTLNVDRLDLYQLHAPDPDVPIATSVRALAALKEEGLVARVGLCNVTVEQITLARSIVEIDSVQVSLGPFAEATFRSGVPEYTRAAGIQLLAHSPLGGAKKRSSLQKHRALKPIAEKHGASAAEIVLAWLADLAPNVVPIPGATREETVASIARAAKIVLDDEDRSALDEAFPFGRLLRTERASRRPRATRGDVVLVMGIQAAGKSTAVRGFVDEGYVRLNRDEIGGRMSGLHQILDRTLANDRRIVLDNTYATRASRNEAIEIAWRHGASVRCVFLDTPIEDAQVNAVIRMLDRHGELLGPAAIRQAAKKDPNTFAPGVQYRWLEELERPTLEEGFESVDVAPFVRRWPKDHDGRALFIELDGVLRRSRSGKRAPLDPNDVEPIRHRAEFLHRAAAEGMRIIALAWLPEIDARGTTHDAARGCFRATEEALGVAMTVAYCPHGPGPIACWCRRPLPGLGVSMIRAHRLDPKACTVVGRTPHDRTFAERLGMRYVDHDAFFGPPP